ncbi:MAG: TolC family protein [Myxococcaceae bacterium]|nr:TolC family protein [Myxococcaceae bacterium]MCA3014359.1 TolC family protein [Myxococcaceae bacterium]
MVWQFAPDLREARAEVGAARGAVERARLLPNPGLDVGVGTIPVGPLNPPGLEAPLLNVPNLSIGLSFLLEVAKRGPRAEAADAQVQATALSALDRLRQRVLDVMAAIADVAAAEVRVATLTSLAEDARKLAALQRARAEKGDASVLDADRAQLEQEATRAALGEAEEAVQQTLRACTDLSGLPCLPFAAAPRALAWLELPVPVSAALEERPDVKGLDAAQAAAAATATLAANRVLPDVTVHAGYVHDRFVISGNQQNSLFVGVSVPLPMFDRGQPEARAAESLRRHLAARRERLVALAPSQAERLAGELVAVEARQQHLKASSLPLARSVVDRLEAAVSRGAAPLQELLLARRAWAELVLMENELDRASFRLRLERARVLGSPLVVPKELADVD